MKGNEFSRRRALKTVGSTSIGGIGTLSVTGSVTAAAGKNDKAFKAENYVETEEIIYRRVQTAGTDILLKLEVDQGKASYAKIGTSSDLRESKQKRASRRDSQDGSDSLKKSTRSMTLGSSEKPTQDIANTYPPEPWEIVDSTSGYRTQSQGVIFERVEVERTWFEDCDAFVPYSSHQYIRIGMELGDYSFDDIGDTIALAVACDALFVIIGSKKQAVKEILDEIAEIPLIRAIPDSICGFIFGRLLDGVFSGGTGSFAFWDVDGGWLKEPKIASGSSGAFDPNPSDMRDNKIQTLPGAHIGTLVR